MVYTETFCVEMDNAVTMEIEVCLPSS